MKQIAQDTWSSIFQAPWGNVQESCISIFQATWRNCSRSINWSPNSQKKMALRCSTRKARQTQQQHPRGLPKNTSKEKKKVADLLQGNARRWLHNRAPPLAPWTECWSLPRPSRLLLTGEKFCFSTPHQVQERQMREAPNSCSPLADCGGAIINF